jgi:DNA-binding transcriptional regulator YdaS (Cro superfamily)
MTRDPDLYMQANPLLDHLRKLAGCKSDAALGALLNISNPTLSKMRHKKTKLSPTVILAIHEKLDVPVATIRQLYAQGET